MQNESTVLLAHNYEEFQDSKSKVLNQSRGPSKHVALCSWLWMQDSEQYNSSFKAFELQDGMGWGDLLLITNG